MCSPDKKNVTNYQTKEIDLIEEELRQAGEASHISPVVIKLDKHRIMSDTDVPPEDFLLRMFGKPCFPRRDLSTITGLEKCGKTFFTSMLMASCAQGNILELERIRKEPLKVLWYDTEQSLQSTKNIFADRVIKMAKMHAKDTDNSEAQEDASADFDNNFFVFNVRSLTYQERMDYLVAGIEAYKPDLVIIDNVSDLLPSVNDAEASIRLIDQLMQLASQYDCNISVVIHLNRTGEKRSLRGWLGTEILHKAFEVFYCEQIEKTDVFSVEQMLSRKYRISETLYYKINDDGLPEETTKPNYQPRNENGQYMTNKPEAYQIKTERVDTFNQKYIIRHPENARRPWEWNLRQLFHDAMASRACMSLDALQKDVMALSQIKQAKYYDKVFELAVGQRVVQTTMDRNGRIVAITIPS